MDKIIDAHCHIKCKTPIINLYNTYDIEGLKGISQSFARYNSIGVHPGYIRNIQWDLFEDILSKNNNLLIGEVGLDRFAENKVLQLDTFKKFIKLSNKYKRNINIHCVKAWGGLFDLLKKLDSDINILFHGFSGSKESLDIALKRKSYFSFSLRELSRDNLITTISCIPIDRLLIESDMLTEEYEILGSSEYCNRVLLSYKKLAEIKCINIKDFKDIVFNNFKSYIGTGD